MASNDLALLEKVMMRLAVAEDSQLEAQLRSLLVPVLAKMISPEEVVRKKVIEVLGHVTKRVKTQPGIKLPLKDLAEQFVDEASTTFLLNFNVLFLEMAFGRSELEEKAAVVPMLLLNISKRSVNHQNMLLHMTLSIIEKLPIPQEEKDKQEKYTFTSNPSDVSVFLDFLLDVILAASTTGETPPGLSRAAHERALLKINNGEQLRDRKCAILDFLNKGKLFSDELMAPLLIVASCDTHHLVLRKGEDSLKRYKIDMENKELVKKLFSIYQGTQAEGIPADEKRLPASAILKTKILGFFSRSNVAANSFPNTLQVIFDGVYGTQTTSRLKSSVMGFVQWVFREASEEQIKTMGPIILSGLLKFLDQLKGESPSVDVNELKSFSYTSIGLLAKRVPSLFSSDLSVLTMFFMSIQNEDQRVRAAIQDGLTMLSRAYVNPAPELKDLLTQLLLSNVEKADSQCRYAAVFISNRIFPFSNATARFISLLSVSDPKLEVKDEGLRGLKPFVYKDNDIVSDPSSPYPDYSAMVEELWSRTETKRPTQQRTSTGQLEPLYAPQVYESLLQFLRTCLHVSATAQEATPKTFIVGLWNKNPTAIQHHLQLLDDAVEPSGGRTEVHHISVNSLLELLSYYPQKISALYSSRHAWLRQYLYSGSPESRRIVARIIGLLSPSLDKEILHSLLSELLHELSLGYDKQYGAASALGFTLSRLIQLKLEVSKDFVIRSLFELYKLLPNTNNQVAAAAVQSIGFIGRYAPLPLEEGKAIETKETVSVSAKGDLTKHVIVHGLIKDLTHTESKLVEEGAMALSNITLGDATSSFEEQVIAGMLNSGSNKNTEVHFTVGEALSIVGAGWTSAAALDPIVDDSKPEVSEKASGGMSKILSQIIKEHLMNVRNRSAACIWLLSIVKNAGKHQAIKSELSAIQTVFSYLLSDNDDVIQEVAAKGLVFVYENGDEQSKKALVSSIMETLSSGQKSGFKIQGETQLFPEGVLGKTPEGTGLSTYQELCSLASEMGQPELVYKFMNLASHHSLWNSRKGAAFAATGILAQSKEQLEPFLTSLVPKLYRHSFDPSPKISDAMKSILGALVDIKKAATLYFDGIMKELLDALNSALWRVREGACLAVTDALQGRTFDEVEPFLDDLWNRTFRVLDDVKETVRLAATNAVRSLSNLTTRICDPTYTSPAKGQKALKIALPLLLTKGITNEAEEVKKFSLNQILKLAKTATFLLKPHIAELAGVLLESLSSLEPAMFSYMSFHTEKMNMSQEQLEEARLAVSKQSPMNETLDICVKYVDAGNREDLVNKLVDLIKTGVGLPTRVGTAKFITNLAFHKSEEIEPLAGRLVNAMLLALKDHSATTRKAFAGSIANVAKFSTIKTIQRLIGKLIENYDQFENAELRSASAVTFLELAKRAPEALRKLYPEVIPVFYIGRHDADADIAQVFKDAWSECAVGSPTLYTDEIMRRITSSMGTTSWNQKQQTALAIKDLTDSVGKALGDNIDTILNLLIDSLSGRVWKGKESLLSALAATCSAGKEKILGQKDKAKSLISLVAKECQKNDKDYKRQAFTCLNEILKTFESEDLFEDVKDALFEELNAAEPENQGEADIKDKPLNLLIKGSVFLCLGTAYPKHKDTQKKYGDQVLQLLSKNLPQNVWNVKLSILTSLSQFFQKSKLEDGESTLTQSMIDQTLPNIFDTLGDAKYSVVRSSSLDVVVDLISATEGTPLLQPHLQELQSQLSSLITLDPSLQDKAEKAKQQLVDHPSKKRKS